MTLAIIGTGNMAQGLATVFSAAGNDIVFGSLNRQHHILWFEGWGSTRRAERHANSFISGRLLHRVWIDFRFRWIHAV